MEALYEAHAKTVYWAAYGVSRDAEAAADAVQNAFLSAHRNMETLETMTNEQARAWLYRVAVNSSIDMLRRNRRSIPVEDAGVAEPDTAPGPEAQAEKNETREAIKKALANLPEKYREPLFFTILRNWITTRSRRCCKQAKVRLKAACPADAICSKTN